MKDLDLLMFFQGIEVARSAKNLSLYQRNYLTNLSEEIGTLGFKFSDTPMNLIFILIKILESRLLILKSTMIE